jgi:hypothetical protein
MQRGVADDVRRRGLQVKHQTLPRYLVSYPNLGRSTAWSRLRAARRGNAGHLRGAEKIEIASLIGLGHTLEKEL